MISFIILAYIGLGVMFEIFMGWVITALENENEEDLSHLRFTNAEKLLNMIVWPYHLITFIIGVFTKEEE